eukprot:CAMPEP_0119023828 /NCGR_PEP_ID=MMETSP1176-20130426/30715_1 /TAXON_ID=265551 /ORGANISM="Synedropsis recta cf, Strain CCMP1620" /LENGTH=269 /DNA_ID=CAMNT_0006978969 /DNA_START=150 /DNA_END=956 /DNA_ORIENTATION=+
MTVENFRLVGGMSRIYRCAKTEPLSAVTEPETEAECIILQQTGLVVDLRSDMERDDELGKEWMDRFGFQTPLDVAAGDVIPSSLEKRVMRIDVQPRARIMEYISKSWLSPSQKAMSPMLALFNPDALHEIRMEYLNERGLAGLNEAIMESGGADLCLALREMTKHLENTDSSIVFHCVQGKDRTGVLSMLCQSILGMSEEEIIEEYFKSEVMRNPSVAVKRVAAKGRFDKRKFNGAPRESMIATLAFIKSKHSSICPGYLDSIRFDKSW